MVLLSISTANCLPTCVVIKLWVMLFSLKYLSIASRSRRIDSSMICIVAPVVSAGYISIIFASKP